MVIMAVSNSRPGHNDKAWVSEDPHNPGKYSVQLQREGVSTFKHMLGHLEAIFIAHKHCED